MHGVVAAGCVVWAWQAWRTRVVSDLEQLRLDGPEPALLRWDRVREVRGDAGRWSTRTVVETDDGQTVLLPQGLEVATVRQWQHEAFMAREYPEQG